MTLRRKKTNASNHDGRNSMCSDASHVRSKSDGLVNGPTPVCFRQVFDLPGVRFDADGKLQIFCGDRIPKLQSIRFILVCVHWGNILTLYTIITDSKLQKVAKNRPSI